MSITPAYLQNDASDSGEVIDFRNWGVPLSRRFRALKIWFVMRTYGVKGFKSYIRNHIKLGNFFASLIASRPDLFKIVTDPDFALTVIRIVPRVPPIFRKLLGVIAEEAKTAKGFRIQDSPCGNEGSQSNKVVKAKGTTITNGRSQLNGQSYRDSTSSECTKSRSRSLVNGFDHGHSKSDNGTSPPGGEMSCDRNIRTLSEGSPKRTQSESASDTDSVFASGSSATKMTTSGPSISNEQVSIDEAPDTKHNPTTNHPSWNTPAKEDLDHISSDECVENWITEYGNMITKEVCDLINRRGEIMLTSTVVGGSFVIRVNGANPNTEEKHLRNAFEILVKTAEEVLGLT